MSRIFSAKQAPFLLLWTAVAILGAYLLFSGLGSPALWGDEAETALVARSVIAKGYPSAYDGKRVLTLFKDRHESNSRYLWTYTPWAQFYATALSMKFFGQDTRAARLPFALAAWFSLFVIGALSFKWLGSGGCMLAPLILLLNPAFINYARHCRYYGLVILMVPCVMLAYLAWYSKPGRGAALRLGIALAILFHVNYFTFGISTLALVLHWLTGPKTRLRRDISTFWIAWALAFVLTFPWYAYCRPYPAQQGLASSRLWLSWFWDYLIQTNDFILPAAFALTALWLSRVQGKGSKPDDRAASARRLLWFHVALTIPMAAIIPYHSFRFIINILPCGALLCADMLFCLWKRSKALSAAACGLLLLTTFFQNIIHPSALLTMRTWRPPLLIGMNAKHALEPTSLDCIIDFLKQTAKPDQFILMDDPAYPVIFYTDMRILDGRLGDAGKMGMLADWILEEAVFSLTTPSRRLSPEALGLRGKFEKKQILCPAASPWRMTPEPEFRSMPLSEWESKPRPVTFYRRIDNRNRSSSILRERDRI
ncbi:MAG: hypothetical protein ABIG11_09655 [bacterium]